MIGRRLADIVEAGPNEFARDPGGTLKRQEAVFSGGAPERPVEVVGNALVIGARRDVDMTVRRDRQAIFAAAAEGRGGFAGNQQTAPQRAVIVGKIVDADNVQRLEEPVLRGGPDLVAAQRHQAGRIFAMADVGQQPGHGTALRRGLFLDFVADAPEDDAGVVAVAADHADQVPLAPFAKETLVAVLHPGLGDDPFVEDLVHYDQAHPVAKLQQFGAGGLWLVRMALQPIALRISSCRWMARACTAAPGSPGRDGRTRPSAARACR